MKMGRRKSAPIFLTEAEHRKELVSFLVDVRFMRTVSVQKYV
jgi:hypothetical protein